ncbi:VTT domain-containing protein [Weissella tructae]|uniref:Selenite transport protein DedA n=2 Tax=Weissella TaxID=46255 RepID=A0ABM5QS53_9LACO|nr:MULTISPECIES: VTT domain-containing protein [Weissella]AIG65836.1 Putative selenite transport protein DedA [Weissella tructae]AIM63215.1 Putative selenite transport protein DedA [Weissella ceti]AIM64550.1 Putative selenite transport protein DedA [Weissella ceti]ELA07207.1 DedA family protein [Weissella ceti NC36]QVV90995.1 VTT domain-containing protein [Weissella tructae]
MMQIIDIFINLDKHLTEWVNVLGPWSYALLFGVIFVETGLVIFPFLPGDSLLFAAGAISALPGSVLNPWVLMALFWIAAVTGDSLNFFLGRKIGLPLVQHPLLGRFITEDNLNEAHEFFVKYGPMAIIFARFLPIIRTLAPFTAAMSNFSYRKFVMLEMLAATIWVIVAVGAGFFFGQIPFIQEHFSLVIFGILFVTALPVIITGLRSYIVKKREAKFASKD